MTDSRVPGGKLRSGIIQALEERPVGAEEIGAALARINRHLVTSGEGAVSSRTIG